MVSVLRQRKQEMLGADELIPEPLGLFPCTLQRLCEVLGDRLVGETCPGDFRESLHELIRLDPDDREVTAALLDDRHGRTSGILDEGREEMLRLNELVCVAGGDLLGVLEGLL
jgi:hypothetical protein